MDQSRHLERAAGDSRVNKKVLTISPLALHGAKHLHHNCEMFCRHEIIAVYSPASWPLKMFHNVSALAPPDFHRLWRYTCLLTCTPCAEVRLVQNKTQIRMGHEV